MVKSPVLKRPYLAAFTWSVDPLFIFVRQADGSQNDDFYMASSLSPMSFYTSGKPVSESGPAADT